MDLVGREGPSRVGGHLGRVVVALAVEVAVVTSCKVCNEPCDEYDDVCGWDCQKTFGGMKRGAAVAFGLVGMFEALRRTAPRIVERYYWTSELDGTKHYDCHCPGCGVLMKARDAGLDEGTDDEWCGVCRS